MAKGLAKVPSIFRKDLRKKVYCGVTTQVPVMVLQTADPRTNSKISSAGLQAFTNVVHNRPTPNAGSAHTYTLSLYAVKVRRPKRKGQ